LKAAIFTTWLEGETVGTTKFTSISNANANVIDYTIANGMNNYAKSTNINANGMNNYAQINANANGTEPNANGANTSSANVNASGATTKSSVGNSRS
jgi:hypothetical protein